MPAALMFRALVTRSVDLPGRLTRDFAFEAEVRPTLLVRMPPRGA